MNQLIRHEQESEIRVVYTDQWEEKRKENKGNGLMAFLIVFQPKLTSIEEKKFNLIITLCQLLIIFLALDQLCIFFLGYLKIELIHKSSYYSTFFYNHFQTRDGFVCFY